MRSPWEIARHTSAKAGSDEEPSTSRGRLCHAQITLAAPLRLTLVIAGMVVGLAVIGVVGWATFDFWRAGWDNAVATLESQAAFRAWIGGFGMWAPAIFLLATTAQVIAAPIPGSVFPAVGAAAFGPVVALALTMSGMLVGSAVVFALARHWGRPLVERLAGRERLDRYAGIVSAKGGLWLFLIYLLPLLPDDAVCAVAGLSTITFRRFLLLSMLGRFPGTLLSVYAAAELLTQPAWVWLGIALVLGVGLAATVRYRTGLESWLLQRRRVGDGEEDAAAESGTPPGRR